MLFNRREMLKWPLLMPGLGRGGGVTEVNDVHSRLNQTHVAGVSAPRSAEELRGVILQAARNGSGVAISGSRHSMGGQQFASGCRLIDMRGMNRFLGLDPGARIVHAEAGIEWPELLQGIAAAQAGEANHLGIYQKQTGADRLSLGGALASNVHGRGLKLKPIIYDVESFELMKGDGKVVTCSRSSNPSLFRLAIGGYGLFGAITSVKLRLTPRIKVRRLVRLAETQGIVEAFHQRIAEGCLYGDFQFATDGNHDSFLRRGVFSCYQPVDAQTPLTGNPTRFHPEDWARLTYYAHTHKRLAFNFYTKRYLATSGQVYYHDWQLSAAYQPGYHEAVDGRMKVRTPATEMITEIYVPRSGLAAFMEDARRMLVEHKANLIYGTVRLIERDEESFLRWASENYACVIFNLHVTHDTTGIEAAKRSFRGLIDLGLARGGSFYLTYHRWATREQVERCYPQFREFLALKVRHDPAEVFRSDWHAHYRAMLS